MINLKNQLLRCDKSVRAKGMCGYWTGMERLDGMKWRLFPAFFVRFVCLEKPGQAKWNWGWKS